MCIGLSTRYQSSFAFSETPSQLATWTHIWKVYHGYRDQNRLPSSYCLPSFFFFRFFLTSTLPEEYFWFLLRVMPAFLRCLTHGEGRFQVLYWSSSTVMWRCCITCKGSKKCLRRKRWIASSEWDIFILFLKCGGGGIHRFMYIDKQKNLHGD